MSSVFDVVFSSAISSFMSLHLPREPSISFDSASVYGLSGDTVTKRQLPDRGRLASSDKFVMTYTLPYLSLSISTRLDVPISPVLKGAAPLKTGSPGPPFSAREISPIATRDSIRKIDSVFLTLTLHSLNSASLL